MDCNITDSGRSGRSGSIAAKTSAQVVQIRLTTVGWDPHTVCLSIFWNMRITESANLYGACSPMLVFSAIFLLLPKHKSFEDEIRNHYLLVGRCFFVPSFVLFFCFATDMKIYTKTYARIEFDACHARPVFIIIYYLVRCLCVCVCAVLNVWGFRLQIESYHKPKHNNNNTQWI